MGVLNEKMSQTLFFHSKMAFEMKMVSTFTKLNISQFQ